MRLSELGEFGLIRRIRQRGPLGAPAAARGVEQGIGDDAAVLEVTPGARLLATCDALVEGVHFLRETCPPRALGWKCVAAGVSDVAAMGGVPRYALVAVGLPVDVPVSFVDELYAGIADACGRYRAALVGGDTVRSPGGVVLSVTLLGEVEAGGREGGAFRRSGARPGDVLIVTGHPGNSAAGLRLLLSERSGAPVAIPEVPAAELKAAHLTPLPRLEEALALRACGGVTAMIDVSDGVASEAVHLATESGTGAEIDAAALPVSEAAALAAGAAGEDAVAWALYGGEDYELLFAADPARAEELISAVRALGTPAAVVGRMLDPGEGLVLSGRDGRRPLEPGSWDHFKSGAG